MHFCVIFAHSSASRQLFEPSCQQQLGMRFHSRSSCSIWQEGQELKSLSSLSSISLCVSWEDWKYWIGWSEFPQKRYWMKYQLPFFVARTNSGCYPGWNNTRHTPFLATKTQWVMRCWHKPLVLRQDSYFASFRDKALRKRMGSCQVFARRGQDGCILFWTTWPSSWGFPSSACLMLAGKGLQQKFYFWCGRKAPFICESYRTEQSPRSLEQSPARHPSWAFWAWRVARSSEAS